MATTNSYTGKFFFVSGIHSGREAFLGKAVDQPYEGFVTLEGKAVHFGSHGFLTIQPFTTLSRFPVQDVSVTIHQIAQSPVFEEVKNVFERSITQINRTTHPLLYRWMETCLWRDASPANQAWIQQFQAAGRATGYQSNPFHSFYEGFVSSANQFRRALFQAPQVHSTRELDKVTDLEGNLTIEIGKITNQAAIRFNQVVGRNNELATYFESFQSFHFYNNYAAPNATPAIGGWSYLLNRIQIAKHWARRRGDTALVREINALTKEGINNLNEVILEHCSALDILIAEAFSQHGITAEIYGEMSPFTGYTSAAGISAETYELHPSPNAPMASVPGY